MPSYETDTTQDNNLRCIRPFADIPVTRSEIMKLHHESMMRNMVEFEPPVPVYQPVMSVPIKQDTDWSALNTRIAQKFRNVANVISSLKGENMHRALFVCTIFSQSWDWIFYGEKNGENVKTPNGVAKHRLGYKYIGVTNLIVLPFYGNGCDWATIYRKGVVINVVTQCVQSWEG